MTRKKRSGIAIDKEILELCRTAAGKTKIVYRCNLNFQIAKTHLVFLVKHQFIEVDTSNRWALYTTTPKGQELLGHLTAALNHAP